jgi:hypothetical protein
LVVNVGVNLPLVKEVNCADDGLNHSPLCNWHCK